MAGYRGQIGRGGRLRGGPPLGATSSGAEKSWRRSTVIIGGAR